MTDDINNKMKEIAHTACRTHDFALQVTDVVDKAICDPKTRDNGVEPYVARAMIAVNMVISGYRDTVEELGQDEGRDFIMNLLHNMCLNMGKVHGVNLSVRATIVDKEEK